LPASRLWSLLLAVAEARAAARRPAELAGQWDRDRFVQPAIVDQRTLIDVDTHLLGAAPGFESIELYPVAPLGTCAVMGHASQNKVLAALRGTEVVSDPTNVMALECARRLKTDAAVVRLATSHRCVRAQPIPNRPGHTASFRIFCLASAGIERENHAFTVAAMAEQMKTALGALDRLEHYGYAFPERRITVLARDDKTRLGERIAALLGNEVAAQGHLEHPYYSQGLRFQIAARANDGNEIPLIDGGAFDWLRKLCSNKKLVFVASGMGSQLVAYLFRRA
jgi:hypothetical protein